MHLESYFLKICCYFDPWSNLKNLTVGLSNWSQLDLLDYVALLCWVAGGGVLKNTCTHSWTLKAGLKVDSEYWAFQGEEEGTIRYKNLYEGPIAQKMLFLC